MSATNRRRGKDHERRIAKRTGGTRVPYSGAGVMKGDVHAGPVFYECKATGVRNSDGIKTYRLDKEDLVKMVDQQRKEGLPLHALVLHYHGDKRDWAVMAWDQFAMLLAALERHGFTWD